MSVEANGFVPARVRVTRLDENGQPDGSSSGAVVSTVSGGRFMDGQTIDVVFADDPDGTGYTRTRDPHLIAALHRLASGPVEAVDVPCLPWPR